MKDMDPAGYGNHRPPGPYHAPQVRVEIPTNGSSMGSLRAVQSNNALHQMNQVHHAGLPPYHAQRVDRHPTDSSSQATSDQGHTIPVDNTRQVSEKAANVQPINQLMLLLSLAEEYLGAAYGEDGPGALPHYEADSDRFRKLVAMGLACLEALLEHWRLQPATEALVRLCYASVIFEETEDYMKAEECLSKGISQCDQYRLLDMKYNMQHLLARVTFATNPKAAVKFLDIIIRDDAEVQQHIPWIYALRFLRASLALRMGQNQETLVAIGQLRAIATVANSRADAALCATASLMEALTHLTRTSAPDRIQNAQTALAAARGSQLHPLAQGLHQLTVMGFVVDLCCSLELDDIRQASNVMYEFISCVDRLLKKQDYWASSGRFLVPLSPQSAERLPAVASSNGVITTDVGNNICLQIFWLPRHAVFPLSYLVCAAVTMHKNSQDLKAEEFLKEAADFMESSSESKRTTGREEVWQDVLRCHIQINHAFALCGRNAWGAARKVLGSLRETALRVSQTSLKAIPLYILYLEGAIFQGSGDPESALSTFMRPEFSLERPRNSGLTSVELNLSLLSAFNVALVVHDPVHPQHYLLSNLMSSLEHLASQNQSLNIRTAHRFVCAVIANSQGEMGSLMKTKAHLTAVLKEANATENKQLLCLTLNFMTEKYMQGVVSQQSTKGAYSIVRLAGTIKSDLWSSVANGLKAATLETQGQNDEAAKARHIALDKAGQLPPVMQRVEEPRHERFGCPSGPT